jgi:hypothetical protein
MAREKMYLDGQETNGAELYPHLITVVGHGTPTSFELTVDGEIDPVDAKRTERTALVSSQAVEGTIETGVAQFRFSGEMANAHVVGPTDSISGPTIHVEYGRT